MHPIYDFNAHTPPLFNEAALRAEREQRILQRQTALLAIAGILMLIVTLMCSVWFSYEFPVLAPLFIGYLITSLPSTCIIVFVYLKQGGSPTWQIQP